MCRAQVTGVLFSPSGSLQPKERRMAVPTAWCVLTRETVTTERPQVMILIRKVASMCYLVKTLKLFQKTIFHINSFLKNRCTMHEGKYRRVGTSVDMSKCLCLYRQLPHTWARKCESGGWVYGGGISSANYIHLVSIVSYREHALPSRSF